MEPEKIDCLRQFLFLSERIELVFGLKMTDFQSELVKALVENQGIPAESANEWLLRRQADRQPKQDLIIEAALVYAATKLGAEL